jgi:DNA end-binding protein Ku
MAEALIDSLADDQLDPQRYRDVRRETLTALINAKASGAPTPETGPGAVSPDLLDALRASIEAAKQRKSNGNGVRRRPGEPAGSAKKKVKEPARAGREARPPKKRG